MIFIFHSSSFIGLICGLKAIAILTSGHQRIRTEHWSMADGASAPSRTKHAPRSKRIPPPGPRRIVPSTALLESPSLVTCVGTSQVKPTTWQWSQWSASAGGVPFPKTAAACGCYHSLPSDSIPPCKSARRHCQRAVLLHLVCAWVAETKYGCAF